MQINSTNNNTNFKSNMPIYKVLSKGADGIERELKGFTTTRGPIQALVTRINNDLKSGESLFFQKYIKDFRTNHKATTTIVGNSKIGQRHILFGDDVFIAKDLREECYRKGNMTEPEINDYIARTLIQPMKKKIKAKRFQSDQTGEQVGLILHANKGKDKYDLKFEVSNLAGKIYAQYPEVRPAVTKSVTPVKAAKLYQTDLPGFSMPSSAPKRDLPAYFDHIGWEKGNKKA